MSKAIVKALFEDSLEKNLKQFIKCFKPDPNLEVDISFKK